MAAPLYTWSDVCSREGEAWGSTFESLLLNAETRLMNAKGGGLLWGWMAKEVGWVTPRRAGKVSLEEGHRARSPFSCLVFRVSDCWDWSLCAGQSRTFLPMLQIRQLRLTEEKPHSRGPRRGSQECVQPSRQVTAPKHPPSCLPCALRLSPLSREGLSYHGDPPCR